MSQRLYLVAAAVAALAACWLGGRCSAPPCPEPPPCPPCADCRLLKATTDPEQPLAPLADDYWPLECP